MDRAELAAVREELAAIQDRLIGLPPEAFSERMELRARQEELREKVRSEALAGDLLSADQIKRRIAELESTIAAHSANRLSHSSGPQTGMGGGIDPKHLHEMNRRMDESIGLDDLRTQLRRLRDRLAAMERAKPPSA